MQEGPNLLSLGGWRINKVQQEPVSGRAVRAV